MNVVFVMIGGFFGSISRFAIGEWMHTENGFPIGTLLINLLGCLILTWLLTTISIRKKVDPRISLLFGTGFIGAFTTFSTLSVETIQLVQNGLYNEALLYILFSILLGLFSAFLGVKLAFYDKKEGDSI
jgi:fluoride exporter